MKTKSKITSFSETNAYFFLFDFVETQPRTGLSIRKRPFFFSLAIKIAFFGNLQTMGGVSKPIPSQTTKHPFILISNSFGIKSLFGFSLQKKKD